MHAPLCVYKQSSTCVQPHSMRCPHCRLPQQVTAPLPTSQVLAVMVRRTSRVVSGPGPSPSQRLGQDGPSQIQDLFQDLTPLTLFQRQCQSLNPPTLANTSSAAAANATPLHAAAEAVLLSTRMHAVKPLLTCSTHHGITYFTTGKSHVHTLDL